MTYINISAAIEYVGKLREKRPTRTTVINWIKKYRIGDSSIGYMSGDHYMIDSSRLDLIMQGKHRSLFESLIKEEVERISEEGIPVITVRGRNITLNIVGGQGEDIPLTPVRYERKHIQYEEIMFLLGKLDFRPKGSQQDCLIYMRDQDIGTNSKRRIWDI